MPVEPKAQQSFVDRVWNEGRTHYRDLPWRHVDDPYAVLVSEVMLQQTQVKRVLKHWEQFMRHFPTVDALAAADTAFVLELWQGLGYNRRALALKRTADICAAENQGIVPSSYEELLKLPGIGQATAAGVLVFALNKPAVYLETNVRSVYIHEFFPDEEAVSDKTLIPLIEQTCSEDNPRGWYYALLDYGAHLKQITPNPSRKSAHYSRQSAFEGSKRQKRAELLRVVLDNPGISESDLFERLQAFEVEQGRDPVDEQTFREIVATMVGEGFFTCEGECYRA